MLVRETGTRAPVLGRSRRAVGVRRGSRRGQRHSRSHEVRRWQCGTGGWHRCLSLMSAAGVVAIYAYNRRRR